MKRLPILLFVVMSCVSSFGQKLADLVSTNAALPTDRIPLTTDAGANLFNITVTNLANPIWLAMALKAPLISPAFTTPKLGAATATSLDVTNSLLLQNATSGRVIVTSPDSHLTNSTVTSAQLLTLAPVMAGTVSNAVAASGLLAVDSTKTNGIAATLAHMTNAFGLTGDTNKFINGAGALATPTGGETAGTVHSTDLTVDNAIMRVDGTSGTNAQKSVVLVGDSGIITGVNSLTSTNAVTASDFVAGATNFVAAMSLKAPTADPVFTSSLQLPNGAAPTTDAFGELAADNNAWAASHGALQFFDGTANVYVVAATATDTPTDNQIPKWHTGGTITWEADETAAGGETSGTVHSAGTLVTDNALVRVNGAGGTNIQESVVIVGDSGIVTGVNTLTVTNSITGGTLVLTGTGTNTMSDLNVTNVLNAGGITVVSNIVATGTVTGSDFIAGSTNFVSALNLKAPLASPALTGNPTVPNVVLTDSDTTAANTAFVRSNILAIAASDTAGTVHSTDLTVDNAVMRSDGTTGTNAQKSVVIVSDAGAVTGVDSITVTNAVSGANLAITGTAGAGYITLVGQSVNPTAPAAGTILLHSRTLNGFTRLEFDNEGASNVVAGRDIIMIATNSTGSNIAQGKVVYVSGSTGTLPNIALARANSLTTLPAIGITLNQINNGAVGQVMISGIANFDTTGFSVGDQIYVSTSAAGAMQNTRPSGISAVYVQRVGTVITSASSGYFQVVIAPFIGNIESGTAAATWTGNAVVATSFTAGSTNIIAELATKGTAGETIGTVHAGADLTVDNAIVRVDGTGGTNIQKSVVLVGDSGIITGVNSITVTNVVTGSDFTAGATNFVAAVALKAPLLSPALTGTPTVPNVVLTSSDTTAANTAFVQSNIIAYASHKGAQTREIILRYPDSVLALSMLSNTNDPALATFMRPVFSNSAATNLNYITWMVSVPADINTAVAMTGRIYYRLLGATNDIGSHTYGLGFADVASSAAAAATPATWILISKTDASGVIGDLEISSETTLTGWAAGMTAKDGLMVRLNRDGAGTNAGDTSTVDSEFLTLVLTYTSTQ